MLMFTVRRNILPTARTINMKRTTVEAAARLIHRKPYSLAPRCSARSYTTSQPLSATALPITATGPPPGPPQPSASSNLERVERKRKQAELLAKAKEIRAAEKPSALRPRDTPLRKRFWKDVHVREVPEGYQIYLDTRPIRSPSKSILTVPKSKPHLAHAIAIEWDLLVSAQQALKNHNIPITSIVSRAQDILEADSRGETKIRDDLVTVMMRYLDTDTLLCWAPEKNIHESAYTYSNVDPGMGGQGSSGSLRQLQMKSAREIVSYLNASIWPGVEIKEVLDEESILPQKQTDVTRSIISGWVAGLPAYDLAALERATLASKSLLIATRLVVEWSEEFRHLQNNSRERFGIEAGAGAASIEVKWQTSMWGEVEDTHDVENEDIRRQLGSSILLLSGWK